MPRDAADWIILLVIVLGFAVVLYLVLAIL